MIEVKFFSTRFDNTCSDILNRKYKEWKMQPSIHDQITIVDVSHLVDNNTLLTTVKYRKISKKEVITEKTEDSH
jgi:hypothetical protein